MNLIGEIKKVMNNNDDNELQIKPIKQGAKDRINVRTNK